MERAPYQEVLDRIQSALHAASVVMGRFTPGEIQAEYKSGLDPVTEADRELDTTLHRELLRSGEGWLSEESADDLSRLDRTAVWIVDPLDGTREFVAGIPEFAVSIAYVEHGYPVAGGILNPATKEIFLGSVETGMTYNGAPAHVSSRTRFQDSTVLASRSELRRGEWKEFDHAGFVIRPMGSVAYKLALVAAGQADFTFTLKPKNEWDVAGGAALVASAGGIVRTLLDEPLLCNNRVSRLSGLIAGSPELVGEVISLLGQRHPSKPAPRI